MELEKCWSDIFQGHIIYVYRSGRAQIVALKGRCKGGTPKVHATVWQVSKDVLMETCIGGVNYEGQLGFDVYLVWRGAP